MDQSLVSYNSNQGNTDISIPIPPTTENQLALQSTNTTGTQSVVKITEPVQDLINTVKNHLNVFNKLQKIEKALPPSGKISTENLLQCILTLLQGQECKNEFLKSKSEGNFIRFELDNMVPNTKENAVNVKGFWLQLYVIIRSLYTVVAKSKFDKKTYSTIFYINFFHLIHDTINYYTLFLETNDFFDKDTYEKVGTLIVILIIILQLQLKVSTSSTSSIEQLKLIYERFLKTIKTNIELVKQLAKDLSTNGSNDNKVDDKLISDLIKEVEDKEHQINSQKTKYDNNYKQLENAKKYGIKNDKNQIPLTVEKLQILPPPKS